MGRLRQQNPQNYVASGNISAEFESVIRYLNAAELGNKTVGELLAQLFDANGIWAGPIELRVDSTNGLEYRVGDYDDDSTGWQSIATLAELRGPAGVSVGEVADPPLINFATFTATSGQTEFAYAHEDGDTILVYQNGVLLREGAIYDFETDHAADTVTLTSGATLDDVIQILTFRSHPYLQYYRVNHVTTESQSVFTYDSTDVVGEVFVFKNGVLQQEGGSNDYTIQPTANTVTMNSAIPSGNLISIVTFKSQGDATLSGFMMEAEYTNLSSGLINYAKLAVADDEIPTSKVNGLATRLGETPRLTISASAPPTPASGDLWQDTSVSPNLLKFYDGSSWLRTSSESAVPSFAIGNANQYLRVNGSGTGLVFSTIDFSSLVARTEMGAANGVASLDTNGKMPYSQLPDVLSTESLYHVEEGAVGDGNYNLKRLYLQKYRIVGIHLQTTSGTCDVQLDVGGVPVGAVHNVSSVPLAVVLGTAIEIDATSAAKTLRAIVSSASSANNLEITLAVQIIIS